MKLQYHIGIVNATPFFVDEHGNNYVSPDEAKSLQQWFNLFDNTTLFKPQKADIAIPDGWTMLPACVRCVRICGEKDKLLKKLESIKKTVPQHDCDIYYYRIPNIESVIFWKFQKKCISYFVELHGDIETAMMATNHLMPIRFFFSKILKLAFRQMASNGKFALSVGPALSKKYIRKNIPCCITTNHLMFSRDYPASFTNHEMHEPLELLFVGHVHKRKGLCVLFEALKNLSLRGIDFRMNIVGNGELMQFLQSYAQKYCFGDKVVFHGQVKHGPELFDFFKNADLFILPSIAAEGVPRVTHEAMAFGCPVIATDIGSIKWQLDGNCGIVIPPNDPKAIENAIIYLLEHGSDRKQMARNAYLKSLKFTWESQQSIIHSFVKEQLTSGLV